MNKAIWSLVLCFTGGWSEAQDYTGIQGSSYAGSLGMANNPATIVNSPFRWDLTLFSAQVKSSTSLVTVENYSIFSKASNSSYRWDGGNYARYADLQANIHLLNFQMALDRRQRIGFGISLRGYANLRTSPYNFIDTLNNTRDFFSINDPRLAYNGKAVTSSWIEIAGTYATTLVDNAFGRLNAGVSVRLSRGLAGFHGDLAFRFAGLPGSSPSQFLIREAEGSYVYSSNFDQVEKSLSFRENMRRFLEYTQGGVAVDLGVEYLIKSQSVPVFGEEEDLTDYTWKFGVSLPDLGFNQYNPGLQSRVFSGIRDSVTDQVINRKMDNTVTKARIFNDSLATMVQSMGTPGDVFRILNPMRLVLNADYKITEMIYVNAELSLPLNSLAGKYLSVKDLNRFTITPRWEKQHWGIYLPVQYNRNNQVWPGLAVRAGPLFFGFHSLAHLFSRKSIQDGGGYIALVLRARNPAGERGDKRLDCPPGR